MSDPRRPIFDVEPKGLEGFNQFYETEFVPNLDAELAQWRAARRGGSGTSKKIYLGIIGLALLLFALSGWDFRPLALIPILGIPVWLISGLGGLDEEKKIEELATSSLMDWIGITAGPRTGRSADREGQAGTVGPLERLMHEPLRYSARWEHGEFEFLVGALDKPSGAVGAAVSGQVLVFEIPCKRRFSRPVAFRHVGGGFEKLADDLSTSVNRVELEDPRFMENFEVWCDDQIAARFALTPAVMERIRTFSEEGLIFAGCFTGQSLHVAVRPYELFLQYDFWEPQDVAASIRAGAVMFSKPKRLYAALVQMV